MLRSKRLHLGALVLNRVLPAELLDRASTEAARRLSASPETVAAAVLAGQPDLVDDPKLLARVLQELGESFLNFQVVAKREAEQRAELGVSAEVVATVPSLDTDIFDIAGLVRLGEQLRRS